MKRICLSPDDLMIYIINPNNEYTKFQIDEVTNEFKEVARLEINHEAQQKLIVAEGCDLLTQMEKTKTLKLDIFNTILQRISGLILEEQAEILQIKANNSEMVVLKKEYKKYLLYIYDIKKNIFKQKLEATLDICNLSLSQVLTIFASTVSPSLKTQKVRSSLQSEEA